MYDRVASDNTSVAVVTDLYTGSRSHIIIEGRSPGIVSVTVTAPSGRSLGSVDLTVSTAPVAIVSMRVTPVVELTVAGNGRLASRLSTASLSVTMSQALTYAGQTAHLYTQVMYDDGTVEALFDNPALSIISLKPFMVSVTGQTATAVAQDVACLFKYTLTDDTAVCGLGALNSNLYIGRAFINLTFPPPDEIIVDRVRPRLVVQGDASLQLAVAPTHSTSPLRVQLRFGSRLVDVTNDNETRYNLSRAELFEVVKPATGPLLISTLNNVGAGSFTVTAQGLTSSPITITVVEASHIGIDSHQFHR